jgi:hypothetical protein
VSEYIDDNDKKDVSLSYSFKHIDNDQTGRLKKFYGIVDSIDEKVLSSAIKGNWCGEVKSFDVMKDRRTSSIKKGKEGYADTFKTKLGLNRDGEVMTEFYDANKKVNF